MVNFEVVGVQYKDDNHSKSLSSIYNKMNVLVIGLEEAKHISTIVVRCSDFYNILEVWQQLCHTAQYFNCKMACWHHSCQFIAYPDSDEKLIDEWAYYIIDYRLLKFGPYAPIKKKSYEEFCDSYSSANRAINRLYREIKEQEKKRADIIYNRFASDVKAEIDMADIDAGTPKIVKKNINAILKMIIGIHDKSKEKYLADFRYDMSDNFTYTCGPNSRKWRVQDYLFNEWLDSMNELKGNYGENYEIAAEYIKKYLMKKLGMNEEKFQDTYYSYYLNSLKYYD